MTGKKLLEQIKALLGDPTLSNDDTLTVIAGMHQNAGNPPAPLLFSGSVDPLSGRVWVTTNAQDSGNAADYARQLDLLVKALGALQADFSKQMIAAQVEAAKQHGLQLAAQQNGSEG